MYLLAAVLMTYTHLQNVSPSSTAAPAKGEKKPAAAAPGVNTAAGKPSHTPSSNLHPAPSPTNGVGVSSRPRGSHLRTTSAIRFLSGNAHRETKRKLIKCFSMIFHKRNVSVSKFFTPKRLYCLWLSDFLEKQNMIHMFCEI